MSPSTIPHRKSAQEREEADRKDRRQFTILAVVFAVVMVALTGMYVLGTEATNPPTPAQGAAQQQAQPALDIPDGGHKPLNSGDRGGSQQLALMTGLIVTLSGGAAYLVYASRRNRRRLEAEEGRTAAATAAPAPAAAAEPGPATTADTGSAES